MNAAFRSTGTDALILVIGTVLMAVSQGHVALPLAAWLGPAFLMYFARRRGLRWTIPLLVVALTAAWEWAYRGTVPLPVMARLGVFVGLSLALALIFAADRWISRRSSGFWTTLVFPCGWVGLDFATAALSPTGSWGSIAYSFNGQLPLLQVVSVTGWTGLTFLSGWFAAVLNWSWSLGFQRRRVAAGLLIYATVVSLLLLFGALRLRPVLPSPTVQTAAFVGPTNFELQDSDLVYTYCFAGQMTEEDLAIARAAMLEQQNQYFEILEREAKSGAELLVWAEANAWATLESEATWIDRGQDFARRHQVTLGMGLAVFDPSGQRPYQNKLIVIDPRGNTAFEFLKARPVPGAWHERGDGRLPRFDAEFGVVSAAICFDMDFPRLIRQAGQMDADVFLAPAFDDGKVRWMHARMAAVRAVEQGFNMVRPAAEGVSQVVDTRGRVLAELDTIRSDRHVLVAGVPSRGSFTLYSRLGDLFSWLCSAGFILLLAKGRGLSRKQNTQEVPREA